MTEQQLRIVPLKYEKYEHYRIREDGVVFNRHKKQLKQFIKEKNGKNYPHIQLSIKGKTKPFMVAQIVIDHFVNNPPQEYGYEIAYIDGDTMNVNANNLQWKQIDRNNNLSLRIVALKDEDYKHYKIREDGVVFNQRGKSMKYALASGKYPQIQLSNNYKTKYYLVSHLVAEHFMNDPPQDGKYEIAYKDGNTQNVNVSNLFWRKRIDRPPRKSWSMQVGKKNVEENKHKEEVAPNDDDNNKNVEENEHKEEVAPNDDDNKNVEENKTKRRTHPAFIIKPDRYIYKKPKQTWEFRIQSHNVSETFKTKEEAKQYRDIFFDILSNRELISKIYNAQKSE